MNVLDMTASCDAEFVARAESGSGQTLSRCHRCGKCTAGCSHTFASDITAHQVMRLAQAGQKDTLLSCLGCGPPIMIKSTLQAPAKLGFKDGRIVTTLENRMERFTSIRGRCTTGTYYVRMDEPVFTYAQPRSCRGELYG